MAIKIHTLDEMNDRYIGPVGTPKRDEFERKLSEDLHAYHVGAAIRQAREAQQLTQAQLGEKMGVHREGRPMNPFIY